jgi:F0F1-type ATP synthase membrane subunit b/b'
VQILLDQNTEREKAKTERARADALVLQRFDEVSATAVLAAQTAEKAKAHGEILIARIDHQDKEILMPLVTKVNTIDLTTRATNGKVKEHDQDIKILKDQAKKDLDEAVANNAVKAATQGVLMIPKPSATTVATSLASITAVISLIASGQLRDFVVWLASKL